MVTSYLADDHLALCYLAVVSRHADHPPRAQISTSQLFYLAFMVTVAMLHVVNNLSVPVSLWGPKSVAGFCRVQDAMTQWWYGHKRGRLFLTAVAFWDDVLLRAQTGETALSNSYKLSIVHFWVPDSCFNIWAGPHQPALHAPCLTGRRPLGMVFSIIPVECPAGAV